MPEIFETTDQAVANELYSHHYTGIRMRAPGRRFLHRLVQTSVGRARVERSTYRTDLEAKAGALDQVIAVRIRSGVVRYAHDGSEVVCGPGDTAVPLPLGRDWSVRLRDVDSDVVVVDPSLLAEVAGADSDPDAAGAAGGVRLLSDRPGSELAATQLWRVSESVTAAFGDLEGGSYPLVEDSAARLLGACVLSAFPHSGLREAGIGDHHDAHTATLRRAVAFVESHPDEPLTSGDIARAAHVSVRAVQVAFRRHLGTTPMAYLRRVRLDRAHHDLRVGDASTTTVAAVAARWGYGQPSRFAADYRAAYGRPPSTTLRG